MLYFLPDLWSNENLVFPALSDSLLAENYSLVDLNSSLAASNNVLMLPNSKRKINQYCLQTLLEQARSKN